MRLTSSKHYTAVGADEALGETRARCFVFAGRQRGVGRSECYLDTFVLHG